MSLPKSMRGPEVGHPQSPRVVKKSTAELALGHFADLGKQLAHLARVGLAHADGQRVGRAIDLLGGLNRLRLQH